MSSKRSQKTKEKAMKKKMDEPDYDEEDD